MNTVSDIHIIQGWYYYIGIDICCIIAASEVEGEDSELIFCNDHDLKNEFGDETESTSECTINMVPMV